MEATMLTGRIYDHLKPSAAALKVAHFFMPRIPSPVERRTQIRNKYIRARPTFSEDTREDLVSSAAKDGGLTGTEIQRIECVILARVPASLGGLDGDNSTACIR
jgi:hypothetical protein